MNRLDGKRLVVMGLMSPESIAFAIGEQARKEGAKVIYSAASERLLNGIITRNFRKENLDISQYDVFACDATSEEELATFFEKIGEPIDGLVHSIGYAPNSCLGESILTAKPEDVGIAFQVSTASFAYMVNAASPYLQEGSSIVALTFHSGEAFPSYNWMSVCKAGLEALVRGLAAELAQKEITVNCISAGPLATTAAKHIPGFPMIKEGWTKRVPMAWDFFEDKEAVAKTACFLISDDSYRTTGQTLFVDGGFSAVAMTFPKK